MDYDQTSMLEDFVTESREHLEQLEPDLLELESNDETIDSELINRIFRAVHSIKGASGFLDLDNINSLGHVMENVLMQVRDGNLNVDSDLVDALLTGADKMQTMIDNVGASENEDISKEIERLSKYVDSGQSNNEVETMKKTPEQSAEGNSPEPVSTESAEAASIESIEDAQYNEWKALASLIHEDQWKELRSHGQTIFAGKMNVKKDLLEKSDSLSSLVKHIGTLGAFLGSIPAMEEIPDDAGEDQEISFLVATVLEQDLFANAIGLEESQLTEIPHSEIQIMMTLLETDLETTPEAAAPAEQVNGSAATSKATETVRKATTNGNGDKSGEANESLRVNVTLLNNLINLAGELVLGRNQLLQIMSGHESEIKGLKGVLQHLNLVTGEMQGNIMMTRMQPIGSIFHKFPRIIRDLAKKMNKEIELTVEGGEVELDKSIIEALGDPLTHLIRNCADHGIEDANVRDKNGKPREGSVLLRAYHQEGMVNIEIVDDGKGIDPVAIKEKAVAGGLLSEEEAERMSDREAYHLIFAPGFSTAKQVTSISGRGVGMDVVKTNIEKLGGNVDIDSTVGKGTRVNLRLPLTLAIIPSMIVQVEEQKFAIPQISIEELVRIRAKDTHKAIEQINGADVFRLRDTLLPLVRLTDVLGIQSTYVDNETGDRIPDRRARIADRRVEGDGKAFTVHPETGELLPDKQNDDEQIDTGKEKRDPNKQTRRWRQQSAMTILVLKADENRYGLIVDNIHENQEIVVKPVSRYLKTNTSYAGATIMGDGSVAIILDVKGISETAGLQFEDITRASARLKKSMDRDSLRERQSLMLFQNGPEETLAMSLALITRIEKITIDQIEHVGDEEYLKYQGGSLRLIRLHDYLPISSPQEEGNTIHVIVPKMLKRPFGILATKVLDIIETEVELDTENITSPGILGSAIIQDKITLLLDIFGLLEKVDPESISTDLPDMKLDKDCHLLLVEDTPFFRTLEKEYLESAGFTVDAACDGDEALEMLQKNSYDLIISDIVMPGVDGFELIKRIRSNEKTKNTPVMAMTSLEDEKSRNTGMDLGFNAFEHKLDKGRMLRTIHNLIEGEVMQ